MAVVYIHMKPHNREIFYVGIGNHIKRAYDYGNRNNRWRNVEKKHGILVDIVLSDVSYEVAKEMEIFLILSIGRLDKNKGTLVNMTDGGDGTLGHIPTDNARKLASERLKGKPSRNKGKEVSAETRRKLSESGKGRVYSEETMRKFSIAKLGKRMTEDAKIKLSETRKAKNLKPTNEVIVKAIESRRKKGIIIKELTTGVEFYLWDYINFFDIHKTTLINNTNSDKPIRCGKHKGLKFVKIKNTKNDIKSN